MHPTFKLYLEYLDPEDVSIDYIRRMIKNGAKDFEHGLMYACKHNLKELVQLLIEHGDQYSYNYGFVEACKSGNLPMAELMIACGANDWNRGLYCACRGGYLPLVKLIIQQGANDFSGGLDGACSGSHNNIKLIKLMINHGARNLASALHIVVNRDQLPIARILIKSGALSPGLYGSWGYNRKNMVRGIKTLIRTHDPFYLLMKSKKYSSLRGVPEYLLRQVRTLV